MATGQVHMLTQIKWGWDRTSLRLLHVTIRERVEKRKSHLEGLDRKQFSEHLGQEGQL